MFIPGPRPGWGPLSGHESARPLQLAAPIFHILLGLRLRVNVAMEVGLDTLPFYSALASWAGARDLGFGFHHLLLFLLIFRKLLADILLRLFLDLFLIYS